MKLVLTLITLMISTVAFGTVTVGAQDCPTQFEGKVKEIIEPVGSSDFFATNKVVIENHQNIKGEADELVLVDVLKNGPFRIETQKDYRVQMRDGKICWIEEI